MRRTEADEDLAVRRLFAAAGGEVFKLSQGYRRERGGTRQTPGVPDIYIRFPSVGTDAWFEVKTPAGLRDHYRLLGLRRDQVPKSKVRDWQRAQGQAAFRRGCEAIGRAYGIGTREEAGELLVELGLARRRDDGFLILTPKPLPSPRSAALA